LRQGHQLAETDSPFEVEARKRAAAERKKQKPPTKLSYKHQRELDQLPGEIESLESSIAELQVTVAASEFYAQENEVVQKTLRDLANSQASLEQKIERWAELESFQSSIQPSN
jgi:ATP-binding cassette subfamily F protein uup